MMLTHWRRGAFVAGISLICLIKPLFGLDAPASVSQYIHDSWGKEQGLTGGAIYAIGQSSDGYLWIGTERGLVRFDGVNFTLIQRPISDAAPVGPVRGLIGDNQGNLWIRLEGPRMLLYRDGVFEDPYTRLDLQDITFTAETSDYDQRIILSGLGDRTFRYGNGRLETILNGADAPGNVISIAATRDGSIWLATQDEELFQVRNGRVSKVAPELKSTGISSLFPAETGGVWIGTNRGLRLWQAGELTTPHLPTLPRNLRILAMNRDHDGNLWIGTDHGIARIGPSGSVSLQRLDPKPGYEVTSIFKDRDGDMWCGGSRGLERFRNGMFMTFSDGLPAGGVGSVYTDAHGRTWTAPLSGGLYWMQDGKVGHISLDGLAHDVVYSISGGDDEIWVGRQHGGLTVLTGIGGNDESLRARTYVQDNGLAENKVYSVHRDRDGTIWAGTVSAGVSRLRGDAFTTFSEANGLPSNTIASIVEGYDGTTWFATPGGLASFANGRWTKYIPRDGFSSPTLTTAFEDSKHVLWVGTSEGLGYLSSGQFHRPEKAPELLREQIFGIAEDGLGFLWLTTSNHLLRANRDRLLNGSLVETDIQSYGVEDGLTSVEGVARDHSVVADRVGRIWISLKSGLSLADPHVAASITVPVRVRIETVHAGRTEMNWHSPIAVPPGVQSITFNYGATNLAWSDRIRFRYKLDDTNQGWSDVVASRQVTFPNLSPGSYVFRIAASNNLGLWNGPETALPFIIEPSFWQTWWFLVLCSVAVLAVLRAVYLVRVRQLTALLYLRHQERLAEREDIARDLHDTFFQAVQSLFLRLHTATYGLPKQEPGRHAIEGVLDDSDRVMAEGREMFIDYSKKDLEKREIPELIADYCFEFASAYPVDYRIEVGGQSRVLNPVVVTELSKIAREALCNAFRHAAATAIEVQVNFGSQQMRLCVRDNGRGIEPNHLVCDSGRVHMGLSNMRKRADRLDAKFTLWSRPGSGTEVEVVLAAEQAYAVKHRGWLLSFLNRMSPRA